MQRTRGLLEKPGPRFGSDGLSRHEFRFQPVKRDSASFAQRDNARLLRLTDENGQRFPSSRLDGKPFAIFFGFTQCPDVCPTSMLEMTSVMNDLGDMARDFRVYFVSVDPDRDTPELLKDYTDSFDPRIIGLTGTADEIAAVTRAYRAVYRKVPTQNGYTMDHTASVYLMNRTGHLTPVISYGENHAAAVDKLRRLILTN